MIYDKIDMFKKYPFGSIWNDIFIFLNELKEDSEEKRYELGNGVFAIVMSYHTRERNTAVLESHKKYIDIQMTIFGGEGIEYYSISDLDIFEDYEESKDVMFYNHPDNYDGFVKNLPGYFSMFWPNDAHMPQLNITPEKFVKKVVVKIPVELM